MRSRTAAVFLAASVFFSVAAVSGSSLPLQTVAIVAGEPYDLGYQLGEILSDRMRDFVSTYSPLVDVLYPWYTNNSATYDSFVQFNNDAYPEVYQEIVGLADGASVSLVDLLLLALEPEIMAILCATLSPDQCVRQQSTDFMAMEMNDISIMAHNDDADSAYFHGHFLFHASQTWQPTALAADRFNSLTYLGHVSGFSVGWNDYIVYTVNSLPPTDVTVGRAFYFITRDVLNSISLDDAILRATPDNVALGYSINIADLMGNKMVNIEVHSSGSDMVEVKDNTYLERVNQYVRMSVNQKPGNSTLHRAATLDAYGSPLNVDSLLGLLGDTSDPDYPIFRNGNAPDTLFTISTVTFDFKSRAISVYHANPALNEPLQIMSLPPLPIETYDEFRWLFLLVVILGSAFCVGFFVLLALYLHLRIRAGYANMKQNTELSEKTS
ncbi:Peptidase C [Pelomyxa schiedti]|nr:Peptidase C [Pelomyxa schiedti]